MRLYAPGALQHMRAHARNSES